MYWSANLLSSFPYKEAEYLTLSVKDGQSLSGSLEVRLGKLYEPFTFSCVMEVDVIQPVAHSQRAILKVYDWRYAAQLRGDQKIDPWTAEHESAYFDSVRTGRAQEFVDRLRNEDDFEEPEEGWNIAENEAYLHDFCFDMFKTETAVYNKLQQYQGTRIPRLFASVALSAKTPSCKYRVDSELFQIHGVLLEFIPGFTLAQLNNDKAPPSSWQGIIDQAIQTVHILSDHGILNEDVRTSNILVTQDAQGKDGYRVVMIDFALCRFLGKDESDSEWGRAKWRQDEEGAVGMVMQLRLKKLGFDLKFEHSLRFLEWAEKESEEKEADTEQVEDKQNKSESEK
jgi:hypothetical protein